MKSFFFNTTFLILIATLSKCGRSENNIPINAEKDSINLSVMQFNTWGVGGQVTNGYDAIINEIVAHDPDVVTLSEVAGPEAQKIANSHAKKNKIYYTFTSSNNPSIISKYPILYHSKKEDYRAHKTNDITHGICKAIIKVKDHEIAIYSAHLDYTHYGSYYPRGYDGLNWSPLREPITDVNLILQKNNNSTRLASISEFIDSARIDIEKNRTVILGGDFNEPSHLDWTEATKNLFDHNGTVIEWPVSKKLLENGFIDNYRSTYPDEVNYPGFTWVIANTWTPLADESDRIDFIYHYAKDNITLQKSKIIGPKESIVKNKKVTENTKDNFILPQGIWPTDHRVLISEFKIEIAKK